MPTKQTAASCPKRLDIKTPKATIRPIYSCLFIHTLLYEAIQQQRKVEKLRLNCYSLPRIETANHTCCITIHRINLRNTQR